MNELFGLEALLLGSVLTGGIYSPVLASRERCRSAPRARATRHHAHRAFALGLLAVAVLPRAWVGPRVPDPFHALSVLLFLVPSLLVQAQRSRFAARMLDAMIRQVARAREQVATQALARTRELELLSSKLSHELKNPLGSTRSAQAKPLRSKGRQRAREREVLLEDRLHAGELARRHTELLPRSRIRRRVGRPEDVSLYPPLRAPRRRSGRSGSRVRGRRR